MSVYCFDCEQRYEYCLEGKLFVTCPACGSTLIVVMGDFLVDRIDRIIEKLEVVWYDHSDMSLGEILEDMFGLPFSDIPDSEIEKYLDDYISIGD